MSQTTIRRSTSLKRRTRRPLLFAVIATLVAVLLVARMPPQPAAAQLAGGLNLSLDASPSTAAVGQVVTFSYRASPPAVAPPFPSITSVSIDYGDGQSDVGNSGGSGQTVTGSFTHVYGSPGNFTATLTASASNGSSNSTARTVSVTGGSGPSVSVSAFPSTVSAGQPVNINYSVTTSVGIGFPQVQSILISYGDGAPLPLQSSSGTVSHTYGVPGTYTITVTATSAGQQGSNSTQVNVTSGGGPSSISLTASPQVAPAGQNINFTGTVNSSAPGSVTTGATIFFGDGQSQSPQSTGAGLIAQHAYTSPGSYTATLNVTDSTGQTGQGSTTVTVTQASIQPPTNVQIVSAPATGSVGQSLNFIAATATPQNAGASIASYSWSWGDGTTNQGQNTTHAYASPGTYLVTLTVTDTTGASAATSTNINIASALPQGITVNLPAGWNLVGGPTGAIVSNNSGPLYTFQAGDTAYQSVPSGTPLRAGFGYWAYFTSGGTITLPTTNPQVVNASLPAGQYIMISNPGNSGATVSGADSVLTFDPSANSYFPATSLAPGQGAWAISLAGGTVSIASGR
jgi:PKD repeat protein